MDSPLPLDARSLVVLHASMTGTAVDVAERIGRVGRRSGWSVAVKGVAEFDRVSWYLHLNKGFLVGESAQLIVWVGDRIEWHGNDKLIVVTRGTRWARGDEQSGNLN